MSPFIFLFLLLSPSSSLAQSATFFTPSSSAANGIPLLTVSQFDPRPASETPGNVGLCFSGGGSRALSATMGQLRALNQMGLLSQAKAISSVSGGSWATAPFTYLPSSISDSEFLGPYVANPSSLFLTGLFNTGPGQLDTLATYNLGNAVSGMAFAGLLVEAAGLYANGVPDNRLWTHLIGSHILGTFGLSSFDPNTNLPNKFFCANQAQCNQILANNPQYAGYYMVRSDSASIRRPFHIINTAMFVNVPSLTTPGSTFQYLAPFHATPFYAGVISSPPSAVSISTGNQVGGGGVQSYAFNSLLTSVSGNGQTVNIQQTAPFALSDITGSSSAAFAEVIENQIGSYVPSTVHLDPKFNYFSAADTANGQQGGLERFSDAGTLDNAGVCAMLAYQDIDNLIVFINTDTPITLDSAGNVVVDEMLPPLFGLQPFSNGAYTPYPAPNVPMSSTAASVEFRFNQVFPSSQFQALLNGLYSASTAGGTSSMNTAPAVFLQTGLTVQSNAWWGIPGGKTVNVLWVYNQKASQFENQLTWEVQSAMIGMNFPWYSTADTGLDATHVNLLAHFSAWALMQNQNQVQSLFGISSPSGGGDADGSFADMEGGNEGRGMRSLAVGLSVGAGLLLLSSLTVVLVLLRRRRQGASQPLEKEMDSARLTPNV